MNAEMELLTPLAGARAMGELPTVQPLGTAGLLSDRPQPADSQPLADPTATLAGPGGCTVGRGGEAGGERGEGENGRWQMADGKKTVDQARWMESAEAVVAARAVTEGRNFVAVVKGTEQTEGRVPIADSQAEPEWWTLRDIARGLLVSKPTVSARARLEGWAKTMLGNRQLFGPPAEVADQVRKFAAARSARVAERKVRYADLRTEEQRGRVLFRETVVKYYTRTLSEGWGAGTALSLTVAHFTRAEQQISGRAVQAWIHDYKVHGLDGLVDQKLGQCGRLSAMERLTPQERAAVVAAGKAAAIEYGIKGRPNVAAAARDLAMSADLPAALREVMHESHMSKSYVSPSVRAAIRPALLTCRMAQIGEKAAEKSCGWTECDGNVEAGRWYVADDMTSNVICWVPWPNAAGWKLCQSQVLVFADVGSMRWLNFRIVIREGGQYNAFDDIWGLTGDTMEQYGLPVEGIVLEGGHWQASHVLGHRTGLSNESRFGGLAALGVRVVHAKTSGGKIIEPMFNAMQVEMDRVPGFIGREQRKDKCEQVAKLMNDCAAGKMHPQQCFLTAAQLAEVIKTAMEKENNTRRDGKYLRGETPLEKWARAEDRKNLAAESAWMFRAAFNVVEVTRNGVRVSLGSGKKKEVFYYDAPWRPGVEGRKVRIYWTPAQPETDAIVMTNEATPKFLGSARLVPRLDRFNSCKDAMSAEEDRKKAALAYAHHELRTVQGEMQRTPVIVKARIDPAAAAAMTEAQERHAARPVAAAVDAREVLRMQAEALI